MSRLAGHGMERPAADPLFEGSWLPDGIREAIGRRLDRLSVACNDVLTSAAVIGRRFSLAALVELYSDPTLSTDSRRSEERLIELVDEALEARIVDEVPSAGRYQFSHALFAEVLAAELSATRKARLHARVARTLEALYRDEAAEHAEELVRHYSEAESVLCLRSHRRFGDALQMIRSALALLPACTDETQRWGALEVASHFYTFNRRPDWHAAIPLAEAALESARRVRG